MYVSDASHLSEKQAIMGWQHGNRRVVKLFKALSDLGFSIIMTRKGAFKISPPAHLNGPEYFTHGTNSCYYPIIRFMKDTFDITLREY